LLKSLLEQRCRAAFEKSPKKKADALDMQRLLLSDAPVKSCKKGWED